MIALLARRALLVAAAAAACYGLADRYGARDAAALWAAGTAVACGAGAALLRTSGVGRITWRNRLAGCLIPWGWRLNAGRLWPIPLLSWAVWAAIGGAVFAVLPAAEGEPPGVGVRVGLLAAWLVDGAALLSVAGIIGRDRRWGGTGGRTLWQLAAVVAGLLAASVALYLGGLPKTAVVVGGGPPLLVGTAGGLFFGTLALFGRNVRWN